MSHAMTRVGIHRNIHLKKTRLNPMFALFLASLFASFSAFPANPQVRVVTEHWPPYNYLDEQGNVTGIATNKVEQVLTNLNLDANIEVFHWAKAMQLAEFEKNVFIYSIYRTPDREARFQWICPLLKKRSVAFYRMADRDDVDIEQVQDAKNYRTSVIRNDLSMDMLLKAGFTEGEHFELSIDEETNVRKLIYGRIDLIIQEENALRFRLAELGKDFSAVVRVKSLGDEEKYDCCIATSLQTDKLLVERIRAELYSLYKGKAAQVN